MSEDLEGWIAIADTLGKSESTVKRWARREVDPLPVKRALGRIYASTERVRVWWERQTEDLSESAVA